MHRWACFAPLWVSASRLVTTVVDSPMTLLLNSLAPRPLLLAYHFFSVAFYSVYCLFTSPRLSDQRFSDDEDDDSSVALSKPRMQPPSIDEYPALTLRSIAAVSSGISALVHPMGLLTSLFGFRSIQLQLCSCRWSGRRFGGGSLDGMSWDPAV